MADDLVAIDRETVALGLLLERIGDTLFPVDEGAVDVEGDPVDLARERHWIGHCAIRPLVDAVRVLRLGAFEVPTQVLVVAAEVAGHSPSAMCLSDVLRRPANRELLLEAHRKATV